jgi:formate C-acetyltransferase
MVQVSKKNPDRFLKRALKIVATGFGQPSVFNTDAVIQELTRQGKSIEDARSGGASGCVESGAFGLEAYILTGYFNLAKILEITLNNGTDPGTGKKIGLKTGKVEDFKSFEDLLAAYKKQLNHFIDIKIKGNNIISRLYAKYMPVPFLSLLIDDCIQKGKDYNNNGARYNTRYIQGVGIGSLTDSLAAVKYHVFDRRTFNLPELMKMLQADFNGYEARRKMLVEDTPRYGNDHDYADDIMKTVFDYFYESVNGRPAGSGGVHRINMLPTTCHVYFGSVTGALPGGRKAGQPLSEGISPVQGADRNGPTSVIKSAAKMDHIKTGGTLLNQKFTPGILKDDAGLTQLLHLVRSYFKMDGHHLQFNVVDAAALREAQKYPGKYRNLIVRVAGYSDYFVDLTPELQNEIIHRTEHQGF